MDLLRSFHIRARDFAAHLVQVKIIDADRDVSFFRGLVQPDV
jgi:hypothetical protein